jgi:type VI secretion system protein ImpK
MDTDDPFANPDFSDRTVVKPIPGGRRKDFQKPSDPPKPRASEGPVKLHHLGQLNPLEHAASGLLALLTRLSSFPDQVDTGDLHELMTKEIHQFQKQALTDGIDEKTVYTARYVLCTAIDEAVLNTPWGSDSGWEQRSLLSSFHQEVSGGERFFSILKDLSELPARNRELLELMYLCLSLGFEGRYRVAQGGKDKLLAIREWLYQQLDKIREPVEHTLSPHWQGVRDVQNPVIRAIPLWVLGAVAIALLTLLYSLLLNSLNQQSDPVYAAIFKMQPPNYLASPPLTSAPIATPINQPSLSQLLASEIKQNQIQVTEQPGLSKVVIPGDRLFHSGSATIDSSVISLLQQITAQLNQLPGSIRIIGHSDSEPINNARFPSNWALSKSRADAVAEIVRQNLDNPARLSTEGRADLEPVASNETRAGKAKNRRVEVILIK